MVFNMFRRDFLKNSLIALSSLCGLCLAKQTVKAQNRSHSDIIRKAIADYDFSGHLRDIKISVNLGRTPLYELGRKGPYYRTIDFPKEIRS